MPLVNTRVEISAYINNGWREGCKEVKRIVKYDCGDLGIFGPFGKMYATYEFKAKEVIEESPTLVKIKVSYNKTYGNSPAQKVEESGEKVYFLKKYDKVWKIFDGLDEKGILFSKEDLQKIKIKREEYLAPFQKSLLEFKKIVDDAKELERIKNEVYTAVSSSVSKTKKIDSALNPDKTYKFSIQYYLKEEFLADDYYIVKSDATKLFRNVFPVSKNIHDVEVITIKNVKDTYGYSQEKVLARSTMNRETFDKINWNGFEPQNLDKVTSVSFFGNSFLKSLEDFRNDLEDIQSGTYFPSGVISAGIPSSICGDASQQCQEYGECDLLNMMKSQGMC